MENYQGTAYLYPASTGEGRFLNLISVFDTQHHIYSIYPYFAVMQILQKANIRACISFVLGQKSKFCLLQSRIIASNSVVNFVEHDQLKGICRNLCRKIDLFKWFWSSVGQNKGSAPDFFVLDYLRGHIPFNFHKHPP